MVDWIGRQREIDDIYGQFKTKLHGISIIGQPGIGKTVLARQISDRFASHALRPATWISARAPHSEAQFREELRLAPQGHLVIIDGLDETNDDGRQFASHILEARLSRHDMHYLVTSRDDPKLGFLSYQLGPMTAEDVSALLMHHTGLDRSAPRALLDFIAGHPLTAAAIAPLVTRHGMDYSTIISTLSTFRRPGLLGPDGRPLAKRSLLSRQIVADVRDVNEELLARLRVRPDLVFGITPRQFEEVSAEIFSRLGYEVTLTPPSKDGGVDIYVAQKTDLGSLLYYVECKRYAPNRPVGVGLINALTGVAAGSGADVQDTSTSGHRCFRRARRQASNSRKVAIEFAVEGSFGNDRGRCARWYCGIPTNCCLANFRESADLDPVTSA